MAMTITATASGAGSQNGIGIAPLVLNNAQITVGATGTTITGTVADVAVTASVSGSIIVAASCNDAGGAGTTLTTNTTSLLNQNDATNILGAYLVKSTASPSSGVANSYGYTAPTGSSGNMYGAGAEVVASGGTLSQDASTPAALYTTAAKAVTCASFTPPGTSLLVVPVVSNWSGSGAAAAVVTDNTAGQYTWTRVVGATPTAGVIQVAVWFGVPASVPVAGFTPIVSPSAAAMRAANY
jgi:hypothetical protein